VAKTNGISWLSQDILPLDERALPHSLGLSQIRTNAQFQQKMTILSQIWWTEAGSSPPINKVDEHNNYPNL
jgi:hypothetical protein